MEVFKGEGRSVNVMGRERMEVEFGRVMFEGCGL